MIKIKKIKEQNSCIYFLAAVMCQYLVVVFALWWWGTDDLDGRGMFFVTVASCSISIFLRLLFYPVGKESDHSCLHWVLMRELVFKSLQSRVVSECACSLCHSPAVLTKKSNRRSDVFIFNKFPFFLDLSSIKNHTQPCQVRHRTQSCYNQRNEPFCFNIILFLCWRLPAQLDPYFCSQCQDGPRAVLK